MGGVALKVGPTDAVVGEAVAVPRRAAPARQEPGKEQLGAPATAARDEAPPFHADFLLVRKLGRGTFGFIYAARRVRFPEAPEVAVKVVSWREGDPVAEEAVMRELDTLRTLPVSQNVIRSIGLYVEDGLAYMVMEKCPVDLAKLLSRMSKVTEETMHVFFEDMLSGLAACHDVGIVHRDVKPGNFLVAGGTSSRITLKLCDFGFAGSVSTPESRELHGQYGTAPFMAPEMLSGESYGAKVDLWALGTLAYALLFGRWPYAPARLSGREVKAAILEGSDFPTYRPRRGCPEISAPCSAWVRTLLRRSPEARLSAAEAAVHPRFLAAWGCESSPNLRRALDAASRIGAL